MIYYGNILLIHLLIKREPLVLDVVVSLTIRSIRATLLVIHNHLVGKRYIINIIFRLALHRVVVHNQKRIARLSVLDLCYLLSRRFKQIYAWIRSHFIFLEIVAADFRGLVQYH